MATTFPSTRTSGVRVGGTTGTRVGTGGLVGGTTTMRAGAAARPIQASSVQTRMPVSARVGTTGGYTTGPLSPTGGSRGLPGRVISSGGSSAFRTALSPTGARPATVTVGAGQARPATRQVLGSSLSSPTNRVATSTSFSIPSVSAAGTVLSAGTVQPAKILSGGLTQSRVMSPQIVSGYAPANTVTTLAPQVVQASTVSSATPGLIPLDATAEAYNVKHKDDPQLQNLKAVKKACGLKKVEVMTAAKAFKAAAVDGKLTRDQFFDAHGKLLDSCKVEHPPQDVKNAVFDLFDKDDNGIVDMMEIVCGVSLLCKGNESEKVEAVFMMFDENGDGFVTVDEMYKFLTTVFKVVCTPAVMAVVNSTGVEVTSVEDMASATTLECFQTADLNHDGKLSLAEFKKWFCAPRNDPAVLFQPVKSMLA